ncbi:MAG: hypothetical protein ABH956_00315 [Candidatus Nealsonbacteria bacterium]
MKSIKILLIILFIYFLAVLQTTFFVHFGDFFNFILILVIIWNLIEESKKISGILIAGIGGFFLDIFSNGLIGFNILLLIAISIFIKLVFVKYVRLPILGKI